MGRRGRATIEQPFEAKINLKKIMDAIEKELVKAIEKEGAYSASAECETDGDEIIIRGSFCIEGNTWYCMQTLESPEENDFDPDVIIDESFIVDIADEFFFNTDTDITCKLEDYEYLEADEPDPDMMPGGHDYDRWEE